MYEICRSIFFSWTGRQAEEEENHEVISYIFWRCTFSCAFLANSNACVFISFMIHIIFHSIEFLVMWCNLLVCYVFNLYIHIWSFDIFIFFSSWVNRGFCSFFLMNSELIFLVRLKLARQFDTYVALSVAVYAVFLDNKI